MPKQAEAKLDGVINAKLELLFLVEQIGQRVP